MHFIIFFRFSSAYRISEDHQLPKKNKFESIRSDSLSFFGKRCISKH